MTAPILEVRDLCTEFRTRHGVIRAVDGVSFQLHPAETLGLVGESGCGKSVTAHSILRLVQDPPGRIVRGQVLHRGRDLLVLPEADLRRVRGRAIAMIFQESGSSLNPVFPVGQQVDEVLRTHRGLDRRAARRRTLALFERVGLADAAQRAREYPHQLSGGMKQRVMIAMALAGEPEVLIADEPTTALDVTIQAQILALLHELQRDLGMAVLIISHNLGVVAEVCDRVAVMYAGRIVEEGRGDRLFQDAWHPYTQGLLRSLPGHQPPGGRLQSIPGSVPDLAAPLRACRFAPRCNHVVERCRVEVPMLRRMNPAAEAACHLAEEIRASEAGRG